MNPSAFSSYEDEQIKEQEQNQKPIKKKTNTSILNYLLSQYNNFWFIASLKPPQKLMEASCQKGENITLKIIIFKNNLNYVFNHFSLGAIHINLDSRSIHN